MKAIVCYYELASQTLKKGSNNLNPFNFILLKAETRPLLIKLQKMKYERPEKNLTEAFSKLQA